MLKLEPRPLEEERLALSRILGRGGFSTVYKASWTRPGSSHPRTVSVKVLLPQYCSSACVHWQQFIEEASFLHACDHQSVLKCHGLLLLSPSHPGLKETYSGPVLAMLLDYIKEGTLTTLLTSQMIDPHARLYSLRQALHVLVDVADGLAHLHANQPAVVHRDIKPGNVLLERGRLAGAMGSDACDSKELLTARIADFGLHMRLGDHLPKLLRQSRRDLAPPPPPSARHGPSPRPTDCTGSSNVFFSFAGAPEGSTSMRRSNVALGQDRAICASLPRQGSGPMPFRPQGNRSGVSTLAGYTTCMEGRAYLTSHSMVGSLDGSHRSRDADGSHRPSAPTIIAEYAEVGEQATEAAAKLQGRCRDPSAPLSSRCSGALPDLVPTISGVLPADADAWLPAASVPSSSPTSQHTPQPSPSGVLPGLYSASHATDLVVLTDGDEAEWVFDLTEATGSLVYMAPEVHLKLPYNTKADVYSFGVLMYELLGRTLLAKTCMGGKIRNADDYLQQVVEGWRPEKPKALAPELWHLVEACWEGDPNKRPGMGHVAAELRALLQALAPEHSRKEPKCHSCVIC